VVAAEFLADGNTLVTASLDKTVRMWDFETRLPLGRPLPFPYVRSTNADQQGGVFHVTAAGVLIPTPDGVLDADLRPETLIDRACERAGRNLSRLTFQQYLPGEDYHATCPQYPIE
jgi:hypothetical protein